MSERQNENTVYIPVTGKQLGVAFAAFLTLVASFPVVNWISPNVRSDPFTGSDADELREWIEEVEDDHDELHDEFIQFKAEQTTLMNECLRKLTSKDRRERS